MQNFQILPKIRDSVSYIYLEHAIVDQENMSITAIQGEGKIQIPVSALTCLMLGPGTNITHAAIKTATQNGCLICWCGEHAERFYATGIGETRNAANTLLQAKVCMDKNLHMEVVRRMYMRRFPDFSKTDYTLQQLRGMEGIRVKQAYKLASKTTGIPWTKRDYKTTSWEESDPLNRTLSVANTVLYGVCQAAIVSLGFSPALGFIHTGKMLSFVYDIADLYKADTTIPAAFEAIKTNRTSSEQAVRRICRQKFESIRLLKRIPEDLEYIFQTKETDVQTEKQTGDLWNTDGKTSDGGKNYAYHDNG